MSKTYRTTPATNPLLRPWRTPFAIAPFTRISPEHFKPAFKTALKEHRAEIAKIAKNEARPSFANTIIALEKSGRSLDRVAATFFNLNSAHTNDALQEIERSIAPDLAKHESAIYLNKKLFQRIDDLFERRDHLKLTNEEHRVLERTHTAFVRAGAKLNAKSKKRISDINTQLATLATKFFQNVLADEQSWHMMLDEGSDLTGLPEPVRAAAEAAAADLGKKNGYAITLARSSVETFLQLSARRDLREEAFKAWIARGDKGGATDNKNLVAEIMTLRTELAQIMGHDNFAAYTVDDTMAKTPAAVRELLTAVWPRAVKRANEECAALEQRAKSTGENHPIAAWDWRFYTEKERKARFDLDDAELRPYLQLDNMIAAAFDTATRLFGLKFREQTNVPVYHSDVRVWEVTARNGEHVGLFLGDYFARTSKRSGAWMSSFRGQHKLGKGARPIIVNVLNFARGADGAPTLLSFDDARTLFHEFGHALHGLLSDVTYPSISGTNVTRDFVELPSQLYEHWLSQPEVLKRYALHYETGKPIPGTLIKRLKAANTFNQGFQTVEYTASALVDLELHELTSTKNLDVARFEKETLKSLDMPDTIVMRHRIPHFLHIMGGYASGYYSYLWSEVMDADAFAAFEEAGDIFDKKTARRLKEHIYAAGNRRDPADAYKAFRGRLPTIDGLMKKRGFA